jgi:hypothetical protein
MKDFVIDGISKACVAPPWNSGLGLKFEYHGNRELPKGGGEE